MQVPKEFATETQRHRENNFFDEVIGCRKPPLLSMRDVYTNNSSLCLWCAGQSPAYLAVCEVTVM